MHCVVENRRAELDSGVGASSTLSSLASETKGCLKTAQQVETKAHECPEAWEHESPSVQGFVPGVPKQAATCPPVAVELLCRPKGNTEFYKRASGILNAQDFALLIIF